MYEIAVIGAGPAGYSAAIFTAKAGMKTVILDSNKSVRVQKNGNRNGDLPSRPFRGNGKNGISFIRKIQIW